MQFWVYMLRCRDGSYYIGHTDDLDLRLWQHEQGMGADWTRRRRPVKLVWCADAPTRDEAFAFERRVKNWSRAKKEALIADDWKRIGFLARPPHERPSTSLGTSGNGSLAQEPEACTAQSVLIPRRDDDLAQDSEAFPVKNSHVPSVVEGRILSSGEGQ